MTIEKVANVALIGHALTGQVALFEGLIDRTSGYLPTVLQVLAVLNLSRMLSAATPLLKATHTKTRLQLPEARKLRRLVTRQKRLHSTPF